MKPETGLPAIDIRDLRVDYGNFIAVDHLTMQVPCGEVFGLVGPNGAGKTSTFRVLASLQEATYGSVKLSGIDIAEEPEAVRRIMGYMPDLAPVPSDLKVWEFLDLFADAHRLGTAKQRRERVDECLAEVRLSDARDKFCKTLSRGQTQRLVLAKTLLHRPRVLILDEPASGMDPLSRRHLRLVLRKLAQDGATVIVSSHILSELAEMCTSLCVMNRGKLLASGSVDEVRRSLGQTKRSVTAHVLDRAEEACAWIAGQAFVSETSVIANRVTFSFEGDEDSQATLLSELIAQSYRVTVFEEQRSSFEDILVQIAQSNDA